MVDIVAQFLGIIGFTGDMPPYTVDWVQDLHYLIDYIAKLGIAVMMCWGVWRAVHWVVRLTAGGGRKL